MKILLVASFAGRYHDLDYSDYALAVVALAAYALVVVCAVVDTARKASILYV